MGITQGSVESYAHRAIVVVELAQGLIGKDQLYGAIARQYGASQADFDSLMPLETRLSELQARHAEVSDAYLRAKVYAE